MSDFVAQTPYALIIAGAAMLGIWLANIAYDYKVPQYISRKLAHFGGAVGFLLCPFLFTSFWWPFVLSIGFTALLAGARIWRPTLFRGVGGSGRPNAIAELNYPAASIVLIGVLWGVFNQPWLAIVPLLFLGAGDGITGLVRSKVYGREVKGNWGSAAMIAVCLLLAVFIHPYWIGAAGAVMATIMEKYTKSTSWLDDNATVPLISGLIMAILIL